MTFLEFSPRFSDVLRGTGNNRSIIKLQIQFPAFQNLLEVHLGHFGNA